MLQGIIKPALENDPFNYDVQRADEISEPGLITDQIIGAIIEADLVVADLTGANPNAFHELAIRHMEEGIVIHMAMRGRLPVGKELLDGNTCWSELPCVRSVCAALILGRWP